MFRELGKTLTWKEGGRFGHAAIEIPLPNENKKLYTSLFKRELESFRTRISDYEKFNSGYILNVYKICLSKEDVVKILNKFREMTKGYKAEYEYNYIGRKGNIDKEAKDKIIGYPTKTTRQSFFQSFTAEGFPHSGENCTSLVAHLLDTTGFELNYKPHTCGLFVCSIFAGSAAAWSTGDFARALKSHTDNPKLPLSVTAVVLFGSQGLWMVLSSLGIMCSIDQSYEDRIYICCIVIEIALALADLIVEASDSNMNDLTDAAASDPENFWGYGIGFGTAAFLTYSVFIASRLALYASYRPSLLNKAFMEHITYESRGSQQSSVISKQDTKEYLDSWLESPASVDQSLLDGAEMSTTSSYTPPCI